MTAPASPRGWYADPFERFRFRWWDGEQWTAYAANSATVEWDEAPGMEPPTTADPQPPVLAGMRVAIAGYVIGVALGFAIDLAMSAAHHPGGKTVTLIASQLGLWTGLVGACVVVSRRRGTGSLREDFNWRFRKTDVGLGLAGAFAARILSIIVAIPIPTPFRHPHTPDKSVFDRVAHGPFDWIVLVVIVCVGAPIIEELFFRGLMQPRLVEMLGPTRGIPLTAALFGAAHMINWQGWITVVLAVSIAGGGLVLGLIRHLTGRLGPSTWAHAFFNAQAVALAGLSNLAR